MKSLAVCIPTYNRSDVIEELLLRCANIYKEVNFDVYIYDSSEKKDTELVVQRFQKEYDNLFYMHVDSDVHSNRKVYMIYEKFAKQEDYDYIWVCSDSIRWTAEVFKTVKAELDKNYDMIIIDHTIKKEGAHEYRDAKEVFVDYAWLMTLYGTTIININTVLNNIEWPYYVEKYCVEDKINFSHLALYFEQLSRMKEIRVICWCIGQSDFTESPLKNKSGWYNDTFKVWCEYWPSAIMSLPAFYSEADKKTVVKKHGSCSRILSYNNLLCLRKNKIFNFGIFMRYGARWKELTDVPVNKIFRISIMPYKIVKKKLLESSGPNKYRKSIIRFSKKYPCIYIYGCGFVADGMADYLEAVNVKYYGFLVSDLENEKSVFRGFHVKQYSSTIFDDPQVGIIIALNKKNYDAVMNNFAGTPYRERVISEFDMI